MAVKWVQDPEAILDYTLDWSKMLVDGDSIVNAVFIPDSGVSVLTSNITASTVNSNADQAATVWLLGGGVGVTYSVTCHVTTSGGRQDDRTFQIVVKEK